MSDEAEETISDDLTDRRLEIVRHPRHVGLALRLVLLLDGGLLGLHVADTQRILPEDLNRHRHGPDLVLARE